LACGKAKGVIFRKGKLLRQVPEARIIGELMKEVAKMAGEQGHGGKIR
jgi:hypothetical protein